MECNAGSTRWECDAAEFEGVRAPTAAPATGSTPSGGGSWELSQQELALLWAALPLILLAIAGRLWGRHGSRRSGPSGGAAGLAAVRGRWGIPSACSTATLQ